MKVPDGACWAKTDPETGRPVLTVRDHCLIVGAVAEAVLSRLGPAASRIAPASSATVAALHDLGKIAPGFQRKCPQVAERYTAISNAVDDHARIGQAWIESLPSPRSSDGRGVAWALSIGAHHGRYNPGARAELLAYFREESRAYRWIDVARSALLEELATHFGPLESAPEDRRSPTVHWLTGLVTFADWIGSNVEWFASAQLTGPLADVWTPKQARENAARVVEELGWHRTAVHIGREFGELFPPGPGGQPLSPRPLQQVLVEAADAPGLYLVEAPMGMGKTEAALAAAFRRWTEGGERGLYFALPTQLTSNRIHDRIADFLVRAVADPNAVRALVHGNAWLFPDRVRSVHPTHPASGGDATDAHRWFASGRRALLAPFGTGTIDQALMAVMAAKHAALRFFALSGKAVVIDEVHSYDPYTSGLVDRLVANLLAVGCSVFVLSATLTARRRLELVAAAGAKVPSAMPADYPLVTRVKVGSEIAEPIRVPGDRPRSVPVKLETRAPDDETTWREIADAAEAGACVVVIRNTVKSAQEAFRRLKPMIRDGRGIEFGLLHSRFTFLDRAENERRWMAKLGRDSVERPAMGAILVATQVVEQSVDIDADLLVTDLAPVDLVIQRLGRLHRHARGSRPDGFRDPRCLLLVPPVDWTADEMEIKNALGPSAWVYPPFTLYQAGRLLAERGCLMLPDDIRPLLEASASPPDAMPEGARRFAEDLINIRQKQTLSAARQGWLDTEALADTEGIQTRWGSDFSALLVLLDRRPAEQGGRTVVITADGGRHEVRAGKFSYFLAKSLHENAIRVPGYVATKGAPDRPAWLAEHVEGAFPMTRLPDTRMLAPLGPEAAGYRFEYSQELGLVIEKGEDASFSIDEEDDSWY